MTASDLAFAETLVMRPPRAAAASTLRAACLTVRQHSQNVDALRAAATLSTQIDTGTLK